MPTFPLERHKVLRYAIILDHFERLRDERWLQLDAPFIEFCMSFRSVPAYMT